MTKKTFEELCKIQRNRINEIQNTKVSIKNTRNTISQLKKKIEDLDKLWGKYSETEEEIKKHEDFDDNHDYIKNECSEKAKLWYENVKVSLATTLSSVELETQNLDQNTQKEKDQGNMASISFEGKIRLQGERSRKIKHMSEQITVDKLADVSQAFVREKLATLKDHWENFEKLHFELISDCSSTELEHTYFTNGTYDNISEEYENLAILLKEKLTFKETNELENKLEQILSSTHITSQTSKFNLKTAQKLIPKFEGNSRDLHRFLSCAGDVYETVASDEDEQIFFGLIKSKLVGNAYDVYKYGNYNSWRELKAGLNAKFETRLSKFTLQTQLGQMRQKPGENVLDFVQRITTTFSLLNEATKADIKDEALVIALLKENEKQAVRAFEDGLMNGQLQMLAKVYEEKKLSSITSYIIDHASRLEQRNQMAQEAVRQQQQKLRPITRPNIEQPICYKCGKTGHYAPRCPQGFNRIPLQDRRPFPTRNNYMEMGAPNHSRRDSNVGPSSGGNNREVRQGEGTNNIPRRVYFSGIPAKGSTNKIQEEPSPRKESQTPQFDEPGSGNPARRGKDIGIPSQMVVRADVHSAPEHFQYKGTK